MIQLLNISRKYRISDAKPALDDVSVEIRSGRFVAITGASGSGKSTLLHLIAALDRPDQGRIHVDGVEVTGLSERALAEWRGRAIGLVFQAHLLLPTLTALENVVAPMEFTGLVPRRQRRTRAAELLSRFGLSGHEDKLPSQLSGGEQQRVGLARALACDPPLVLADEPTGNLDSVSGAEVLRALADVAQQGKTVLMVTHNTEAASLCDQIVHIVDGRFTAPRDAS